MSWFYPLRFRPELLVCEIRDCVTQGRFGFTTLLALHSTARYVNSISVCVCVGVGMSACEIKAVAGWSFETWLWRPGSD